MEKINKQKGEGEVVGLVVFGLIIWGVVSLFSGSGNDEYTNDRSYGNNNGFEAMDTRDCSSLEPDNPYGSGSGHSAGFEWAESNDVGSCGGKSDSFIEGCEEYLAQSEVYEDCLNN